MSKLPTISYGTRLSKLTQMQFGGLRHNDNAQSGEIYDMWNLDSEHWPLLGTRKARYRYRDVPGNSVRFYADGDTVLTVKEDNHQLIYENAKTGFSFAVLTVKEPLKAEFVKFGSRVILMPEKKVINIKYPIIGMWEDGVWPADPELYDAAISVSPISGEYKLWVWDGENWQENGFIAEPIDAEITYPNAIITDGTIYNSPAKGNTIRVFDTMVNFEAMGFKAGDGVEISGFSNPKNNKIAIIREVIPAVEGDQGVYIDINFSDNCFDLEGYDSITADITLKRTMPEMDILFAHNNRFWGAKCKEIFASKLGDPRNWNVFDGLASDSWYMELPNGNEITGGCSFQYPRFYREKDQITVYGSIPSNFQTQEKEILGVKKGEAKSLCQCGDVLCYLSPEGLVLSNGQTAYLQDQVFGGWEISQMIGSSDGHKMYLYADLGKHPEADGERLRAILVYDTQKQVWTKESCREQKDLAYANGNVLMLEKYGNRAYLVSVNGEEGELAKDSVYGSVEFGDFTADSPDRKGLQQIQIRAELEEGAYMNVWAAYDGGSWRQVGTVSATSKKSINLPVIIRRCDYFRLKIEGAGPWKIYSMARKIYVGSDKH